MENIDIKTLQKTAKFKEKENLALFNRLKKKKPNNLDDIVQELDEKFFKNFDCLKCANCCKTLGPRITIKDIERLSSHLKMKEAEFITKYLKIDEDNDYVFKSMPCPFLDTENYCIVYEHRPKACKEYPHTSQPKFHQRLNETFNNIAICPAVFEIVEKLKQRI